MSQTIECQLTSATFAREANPSTRYYTAAKPSFFVSSQSGTKFYTYMHFALPADLASRRVISALLTQTMETHSGSPHLVLQRHSKPATPYDQITWNNHPVGLAGAPTFTTTHAGSTQSWTFDITTDIQAISQGAAYYGYVLVTSDVTDQWRGWGWGTDQRPTLVIVLDDAPAEPTDLAPQGGIGLAKPVITWTAVSDITSAQVQVTTTADTAFSAPVFDSGPQSVTVGQLDLNALGYGGIGSGASVLVRVRQSNVIGTSDWSDAVTITYTPLGTLTVTSPASTTPDPTPTVAWTFTGTQVRWQVTTIRNGKVVADTGVVAGTDTAYQPHVGATATGDVLSYRVRVWDNAARVPSPGDPGYREVTVNSTYTPGTVTAISTLTATQDGGAPWVDLAWTRTAGVPDQWVITRGGHIIDIINATSGGSPVWTYRDWSCPPNTDTWYRVFPKILTGPTVGSTGPTTTMRTEVDGVWVFDPDTSEYFTVSGDKLSVSYGEVSTVYETNGGQKKVKRTWALRGLEGTVGGLLDDYDDRTVDDQLADLWAIKSRPDVDVRMILGNDNIPVSILNLSPPISSDFADVDTIRRDVSFDFFQTGEFPFPEVAP